MATTAPIVRSYSASAFETTTTDKIVTISKPSGVVSGDLLVAMAAKSDTSGSGYSAAAGWTLILNTSSSAAIQTWWKLAGGSEPSTYDFNTGSGGTTADFLAGVMFRIDGHDGGTPIDASGGSTGESQYPLCPSVAIAQDTSLTLRLVTVPLWATMFYSGTQLFPTASVSDITIAGVRGATTTQATTGTFQFDQGSSDFWTTQTIVIAPTPEVTAAIMMGSNF